MRRITRGFVLAGLGLMLSAWLEAQCGSERRDLKSAFDGAAANIAIGGPTQTTIEEMVAIPPPQPIPATRVSPAETTAWTLEATLEAFKLEGGSKGDHDYHLVLHDDSGRHMIAEIPSPQCISQGGSSAFQSQIEKSRSDFDAQFNVTTSFQDAGIPVRITGIGLFDFAHGQRGYAINGIELHPVLEIVFNPLPPGGPTPTPGPSPTPIPVPSGPPSAANLIGNPGFESGANVVPWKATDGVINNHTDLPSHSGAWKAWLGGYGSTHTDRLYQDVAIPSSGSTATLSFFLHIGTAESADQVFDTLKVQIRDTSNHVLATLATFSNRDANVGYGKKTFDLSSFAGQTVRLYFLATEDNGSQTSFIVDDVSLVVQ